MMRTKWLVFKLVCIDVCSLVMSVDVASYVIVMVR